MTPWQWTKINSPLALAKMIRPRMRDARVFNQINDPFLLSGMENPGCETSLDIILYDKTEPFDHKNYITRSII